MFFENEYTVFTLLDILRIKQRNLVVTTKKREFCALSLRMQSDAEIETDKNKYELKGTSVCFFPSGINYERRAKTDDLIVFHFIPHASYKEEPEFFFPTRTDRYVELFERAYSLWQEKAVGYKLRCSALLCEILALLYEDNLPKGERSVISPSVEYIDKNYTNADLSLSKVAALSNVSEVYFRRLFKKKYGVSPKKYLIDKRINYALALMNAGYYTVSEIAYACGFSDAKYFSVSFKRVVGVSPSEYSYGFSM